MGTVVGIENSYGVVLGGDRTIVEGGMVKSKDFKKVFDHGKIGVAATGKPGNIESFSKKIESEIRQYEIDHGTEIRIDRLSVVGSRLSKSEEIDALLGGYDENETPRLRTIGKGGGVIEETMSARGTGASIALGVLESTDEPESIDDTVQLAKRSLRAASKRNSSTGNEFDFWVLES